MFRIKIEGMEKPKLGGKVFLDEKKNQIKSENEGILEDDEVEICVNVVY